MENKLFTSWLGSKKEREKRSAPKSLRRIQLSDIMTI